MEIRDGDSSTSPLLGELCGSMNWPLRFISNGPSMFVRLRSDGSGSYKAFRAVYIAVYDTEGTVIV